ncbi:MAG: DUF4160 domain-containing protein [Rubrivivax sp.]|nr:DUF4160 domain-containing protein [Rubrivivax sp.]
MHVHVRAGGSEAKLWLEPQVRVASSYGFDGSTLRELVAVAQANGERARGGRSVDRRGGRGHRGGALPGGLMPTSRLSTRDGRPLPT